MKVPVQVQLQQVAWIIARAARSRRLGPHEPQLLHIQLADKRLDHPADMIDRNQIVQHRRKQRGLPARFTLYVGQRKYPRFREGIFASHLVDN
jgi:hypothetical protein